MYKALVLILDVQILGAVPLMRHKPPSRQGRQGKTYDCGFVFSICLAFSAPWRLAPNISEVKGNETPSGRDARGPRKELERSRVAADPPYSEINAATLDDGSIAFEGLLRAEARLTGGAFKSQTIPNHDSALRV